MPHARKQFPVVGVLGLTCLVACSQLKDDSGAVDGAEERALATAPAIRLEENPTSPDFGTVQLVGIPDEDLPAIRSSRMSAADWSERFAVYTGTAASGESSVPPVLGEYERGDNAVRFRPRFPLINGLRYTARVDIGSMRFDTTFALPALSVEPTTVVTQIFPTSAALPMNQLRMYIHFSAPMRMGDAYDHLRLIDVDSGTEVADPFVIIEEELWDPSSRRFTLLFDSGRIKRGLRPNEEIGLPLREGKSYRLIVDRKWRDAGDLSLVEQFEKPFRVVAADRESPRHTEWQVSPPEPGTRAPVTLSFPEPLDRALLDNMLDVRDADGQSVQGEVKVGAEERAWRFSPSEVWRAGRYVVVVDTGLEDLAGNNLRRLFDVDLDTESPGPLADVRSIELPFDVR